MLRPTVGLTRQSRTNFRRPSIDPYAEPQYVASRGDTLVFQPNLDACTVGNSDTLRTVAGFTGHRNSIATDDPLHWEGQDILNTGRTPGTNCVRSTYSQTNNDLVLEYSWAPTEYRTMVASYYYRLSVNADPTAGNTNSSGFKWWMWWRDPAFPRQTWGVSNLDQNSTSNGWPFRATTGNEFSFHDNTSPTTGTGASPNPILQNITTTPSFASTADGNWHRYTTFIHIGTVAGDMTGYAAIWVDGIRVLDTRAGPQIAMDGDHGFTHIQIPGNTAGSTQNFNFWVDFDDLTVWSPTIY